MKRNYCTDICEEKNACRDMVARACQMNKKLITCNKSDVANWTQKANASMRKTRKWNDFYGIKRCPKNYGAISFPMVSCLKDGN